MANEDKSKEKQKQRRPKALKRDEQNQKRSLRNRALKSRMRTAIRTFEETLEGGDASAAKENLNLVYSIMDKSVQHGVIKLNTASRTKARLTARVLAKA
jgi:small subunit ribosomal protein S20